MQIQLTDAGKRFNFDWIFRHVSYRFRCNHSYAITGANGSGKSTLLQSIAGALLLNEGNILYSQEGKDLSSDAIYAQVSMAAPYLELIEEMTADEMLDFHGRFKKWSLPKKDILENVGLKTAADKQIRFFSSGMKQRLKLAQAFFSDTAILLLDEPCSNLDENGINTYHTLLESYCRNRIVIIASNDKQEYGFCKEVIDLSAYK